LITSKERFVMNCIYENCSNANGTHEEQVAADAAAIANVEAAPAPGPRTNRRVFGFFAAGAIAAAALAATGFAPRAAREAELTATTHAVNEANRSVTVVHPTRDGAAYELRLPGSTAPLQVTVLHARTNGYLRTFHADIGDRAAAGQVLAEIEAPEVDDQLREARATLEQNKANLVLAAQQLARMRALWENNAGGRGELDDLTAKHNAAVAAVRVSEAVVSRLATEQSYQKVVAPFPGVVTQRNVELGSLVTAGSAAGVTPLFRLEQTETLKVFVDVPQTAAPGVAVGQRVRIEFREFPGRQFEGKIVRTAGSVDPATRTLRTEIHLPNPKGELLAGMYAQVRLGVQDPRNPLRVPAAALVADAAGTQVVTVDASGAARRRAVTLGRDFGREVEVVAGLDGGERIVVNPRDDLRDGDLVQVVSTR
jgi:RND family efflux transporter MFP subunit